MNDKQGKPIKVGDRVIVDRPNYIGNVGKVLTVREIDRIWPAGGIEQMCRCDNAATQEDSDAGKATHSAWLTSKEIIV